MNVVLIINKIVLELDMLVELELLVAENMLIAIVLRAMSGKTEAVKKYQHQFLEDVVTMGLPYVALIRMLITTAKNILNMSIVKICKLHAEP